MEKKYWKGVDELRNDAEFVRLKNNEFYEPIPIDEALSKKAADTNTTHRRDFLKFLGFSVAAASLAACEAPVKKTIPYLIKPENITPGIADYYASTYFDGYDYSSLLVKTREGRPIKVDGNNFSSLNHGKSSARVQASVLSLYDGERLQHPLANGAKASWVDVDKSIVNQLTAITAEGKTIRILTSTIISPSTKRVIADFIAKYPGSKHIMYDAVSVSAMRQAHQDAFGLNVIPAINFHKAETIVGIGCDFLTNWIAPIEYAGQYAITRKLDDGKKNMSKHYQFEAALSVTGSNADVRIMVKPSQYAGVAIALYNAVATAKGVATINGGNAGEHAKDIEKAAADLLKNAGKSVVVSGANDLATQQVVAALNHLLGNYGTTLDLDNYSMLRQGNDADLISLIDELKTGTVGALLIHQSNPAYTLPASSSFAELLKKVNLTVSFASKEDETAALCKFVCPDHHSLESWGDAQARKGHYSLQQPTINPIFDTRQFEQSLLNWSGSTVNYYDYVRANWSETLMSTQNATSVFDAFWNDCIQKGVYEVPSASQNVNFIGNLNTVQNQLSKSNGGIEVVIYEKVSLGSGVQSNNPWLQELPDPISKITWDNYLTISPKDARDKNLKQGNILSVKINNVNIELPVAIQPGQCPGTVGVALGYGRTKAGKTANNRGANAYSLIQFANGTLQYNLSGGSLDKTTKDDYVLAATQSHHTMMGRAIVKEASLADYIKNPNSSNEKELFGVKVGPKETYKEAKDVNLWDNFEYPDHHWGMGIDLNSCIGCGACVIACTSENNVAVVGRDEVIRSREMHWMRIDRYYSSTAEPQAYGDLENIEGMEVPEDNPSVVFQPVMCQHCNHAPCETVCPVIATSHSSDGLNQMTYNRCVGTRYCANNCPYKVRRFNWFKYFDNPQFDFNQNDNLGKMVINPDVTVRSRGVMEKCSMCVQRIQEGKLNAKKESRKIKDGEIVTACAQSCPTNAIVFGDFKDENSRLVALWKPTERSYHLLEELNVQPNIYYQTKVRNVEVSRLAKGHGAVHEAAHENHGNNHGSEHESHH